MKRFLGILVVAIALLSACKSTKGTGSSSANIESWIVGSTLADCGAGDGSQCLQVKRNGEMDYELISNTIEGFTYESGFKYSLEVEVKEVKGAMQYKLITELFKVESK